MTGRRATANPHMIALAADSSAPTRVMLLPIGIIEAVDGRRWVLDDPQAVIEASAGGGLALPIDWEHGQDMRAPQGERADAAGWIEALDADDTGIFARVAWTEAGRASIESRAYRYISPVFAHDDMGRVVRILGAALVNRPAIVMPALARRKETSMDKELIDALGLPPTAVTADAVTAIGRLKSDLATATARAETPDLTKFVPRADYDAVLARAQSAETKVAETEKAAQDARIGELVDKAIAEGKIAPASKDFYVASCRADGGLAAFEAFVATAPRVLPAREDPDPVEADTDDPVALARAATSHQQAQAAAGRPIDYVTAVREVKEKQT